VGWIHLAQSFPATVYYECPQRLSLVYVLCQLNPVRISTLIYLISTLTYPLIAPAWVSSALPFSALSITTACAPSLCTLLLFTL
jgi:hypothetical protein